MQHAIFTPPPPPDRRSFLLQSAAAVFPLLLPSGILGMQGRAGANDKIVTAHIGVGYRGRILLGRLRDSAAALCDVDSVQLHQAAPLANATTKHYSDYRQALDRQDIDAVVVASPDHWHAIHTIHACEAGKDVFVETPACKTLEEGRRMLEAARQYGSVVQVGAPGPLTASGRAVQRYIATMGADSIRQVSCWGEPNPTGGSLSGDAPPPTTLDWDQWLGPCPWSPYNPDKVHGNFRWMLEYGGGQLCHQGAHCFAFAIAALAPQVEQVEVSAQGVAPAQGLWNCPPNLEVQLTLQPAGIVFHWKQSLEREKAFGVEFGGTETILVATPDERATASEKVLHAAESEFERNEDALENWIRCISTRELPEMGLERGVLAADLCQIANLSYLLGRRLVWDRRRAEFANDEQANRLRGRLGRGEWRI